MDLNFFLCYMVDIQLLVCAWQLDSVVQLVRALHRNYGAAGYSHMYSSMKDIVWYRIYILTLLSFI
jgi:uncharacterized protein YihD (DUF1040 family)